MPTPPTGTLTASGDYSASPFLSGFSGWSSITIAGVTCDNTNAYFLISNATNPSIGGGALECHLVQVPWATWTVAGSTRLTSFTRTTGTANHSNALGRRRSDGMLVARLNDGDLYTFDPGASYAANYLGDGGGPGATDIAGVMFDPTDDTLIWSSAANDGMRRWRIGTGTLGIPAFGSPTYSIQSGPDGRAVGVTSRGNERLVVVWDLATGMRRYAAGIDTLTTQTNGAGNGNFTETIIGNRATLSTIRDVCMDLDGRIYAACSASAAFGIRTITADWTTVATIATSGSTATGSRSHIGVSPDGSKVVYSAGGQVVKIT